MSVLRALALALAVAGAGAVAVPLAVPSLMLTIDVPGFVASAPMDHSAHAGHAAATKAAPAHAHASTASDPQHHEAASSAPDEAHAGHGEAAEAAGHEEHAVAEAGDHGHDDVGMQRPRFPPASGKVPDSPDGLRDVGSIFITGDEGFEGSEASFRGKGTLADPYVLRGVHIPQLSLVDTDACVEIAESWIDFQLTLDWNGQCVWAHHNHITDLRVNQNNPRTGYATGGLIEANEIGVVGQLRHYDGEFRNNVVGPVAPDMLFDPVAETVPYLFVKDTRAANIDGFNQGLIHHNTFYGSVDLDLHGHHHGTGFFAPHSHYHGDSEARMAEHVHDHTDRWTSVAFTDNTVIDVEGYGLRYEDENHAGDDRTANSESTEALNDEHVHHTDIVLARNTIDGGHLWVDVFNADDMNHKARNPGTLTIEGNTVTTREPASEELCEPMFGDWYDSRTPMHIHTIKEVELLVLGNTLTYLAQPARTDLLGGLRQTLSDCTLLYGDKADPAAIRLEFVRDASILIQGNVAKGVLVGVDAREMDGETQWRVVGNSFPGAAVHTDDSVANQPERS